MEPGIAKTSRPCSVARRAVMRAPLCRRASTTSVPTASPLMMRLRRGKFSRSGGTPGRNSEHSAPRAGDGIGKVRHCAAGRPGRGRCRAPRSCCLPPASAPACAAASMPSARPLVIARPQPARCAAKACAVSAPPALALRLPTIASCGSARARRVAAHEQRDGRMLDLLQERRVARVVPGDEMVVGGRRRATLAGFDVRLVGIARVRRPGRRARPAARSSAGFAADQPAAASPKTAKERREGRPVEAPAASARISQARTHGAAPG